MRSHEPMAGPVIAHRRIELKGLDVSFGVNCGGSVGNVAEILGYANPFAFSRAFSRLVGVSPGRFAANCRD